MYFSLVRLGYDFWTKQTTGMQQQ